MDEIRTFIALDLPKGMITELQKVQKSIMKEDLFFGKFTDPEHMHLTLKFLGEVSEEQIEKTKEKLSAIKMQSFDVAIDSVGVFSEAFVRIIWASLTGADELQKDVDEQLKELFPIENRFMSHITIARVKDVKEKEPLITFLKKIKLDIKGTIKSFSLVTSTLTEKGPIYDVLETYALN